MNKNIAKTVYKVSDFISWQKNKSLVLSPSFQRRSVWPKAAKSLLIDTIVRGIPIPIIFLREKTDLNTLEPMREVVDGQQRLRTLIAYIDSKLLKDYDKDKDSFVVKKTHNQDVAGKSFGQLDENVRRRILNYDFSVHILPSDTDDRDVLQIFARMNSTGVKLSPQELRNAEYYGVFKSLAYNLAYEQLARWRKWEIFTENDIARMVEVEETSEFLRLMMDGIQSKSQPALDEIYKTYEEDFPEAPEAARRFHNVMDKIDETLGEELSSLAFSRRALFETLFSFYYQILFGLDSSLKKRVKTNTITLQAVTTIKKASAVIMKGDLPDELSKVLRGGTGNKESRLVRLSFLNNMYKDAQK
jgi:hypothetical protein